MMLTHGDSPLAAQTPPPWRGKILHATLTLGDQTITGGDVAPGQYCQPRGIDLLLHADTAAEAERIFAALAENGEVRMPLQETFWTARFGMLIDRFGIPWMIAGSKPADVNPVF